MMGAAMHTAPAHQFYRSPQLPWAELRVSQQSPHCYRLHMHAEYSLGLVDAGQAVFTHTGGPQHLQAGSVVVVEPGAWHACNPAQVTHWSYRMLYLQADWLHALLGLPPQHPGLQLAQRAWHEPALYQQLHALCTALRSGQAVAADWCRQLQALLAWPGLVQRQAVATAPPEGWVQHAIAQLHQPTDSAASVQALAQGEGMSASRFIRRFKAATGVTPGAYRLNVRINGARRLLAQGMPLADAAHAMGFADQAHLQRTFKAHHAATPGRYAQGAAR